MKKTGFTLAEVLITLGIVGVVSALVLPTFTTKMQTAKVGPRLAKAVAAFEQANIAILEDNQADALTATELLTDADTYFGPTGLQTHMKGSYNTDNHTFYSADGSAYCVARISNPNITGTCFSDNEAFSDGLQNEFPHLSMVTDSYQRRAIMIDIDGDNGPNTPARDRFFFQLMDNGSLRPYGGSWDTNQNRRWETACPKNSKPPRPNGYIYCAGHVMENGLKVEYK